MKDKLEFLLDISASAIKRRSQDVDIFKTNLCQLRRLYPSVDVNRLPLQDLHDYARITKKLSTPNKPPATHEEFLQRLADGEIEPIKDEVIEKPKLTDVQKFAEENRIKELLGLTQKLVIGEKIIPTFQR